MKDYTVVLLRPKYLCNEESYGLDIYVASRIKASGTADALKRARNEVFKADKKGGAHKGLFEDCYDRRIKPVVENYKLCVMFEGHHDPVLFGWQVH